MTLLFNVKNIRKYQKSMRGVGNEGIIIFVLLHSFNDHAGCNPIFVIFQLLSSNIFVSNLIEPEAAIESVNIYEHYKLA